MPVGPFTVTALTDAVGVFPETVDRAFPNMSANDAAAAYALDPDAFPGASQWRLSFRVFVIRDHEGNIVIVDLGVGGHDAPASSWAPTPGDLPQALARADVNPLDVTTVILTHVHADHCGWVLDEGGGPLFPNAAHLIQKRELDTLNEFATPRLWAHVVRPLADEGLLRIVDGRERLNQSAGWTIDVELTPGHTPGHQSLLLTSRDHRVLLAGDVFVHAVQIVAPDVVYAHEDDPVQAVATRQRLLAQRTRADLTLGTAHAMKPFIDIAIGGR
jgi:glyoxylase-like metal-dependent hydrolase (beta-lactamase superfamily II)